MLYYMRTLLLRVPPAVVRKCVSLRKNKGEWWEMRKASSALRIYTTGGGNGPFFSALISSAYFWWLKWWINFTNAHTKSVWNITASFIPAMPRSVTQVNAFGLFKAVLLFYKSCAALKKACTLLSFACLVACLLLKAFKKNSTCIKYK